MYKPNPFRFIQNSGLFRVLVYTGFWFILRFGLYRIPGLFSSLVYTGFWFIQGFRMLYKPKPE
jgi:hypothetical protein